MVESQSRHRTAANFYRHRKQFAIASPELVSSPSLVITSLRQTNMDITMVAAYHRTPSMQKLVFYYRRLRLSAPTGLVHVWYAGSERQMYRVVPGAPVYCRPDVIGLVVGGCRRLVVDVYE